MKKKMAKIAAIIISVVAIIWIGAIWLDDHDYVPETEVIETESGQLGESAHIDTSLKPIHKDTIEVAK